MGIEGLTFKGVWYIGELRFSFTVLPDGFIKGKYNIYISQLGLCWMVEVNMRASGEIWRPTASFD
jgi:hypothetical protein